MFRALLIDNAIGAISASVAEVDDERLPAGDVAVDVSHSSLNYKDGLVLTGGGGLVKTYPHVPGIDFAGTVRESSHSGYRPGDPVILTGWRVGELRWGGYAERARVSGDWLVPLPTGWTAGQAMAVGTAGFTAMLSLMALEDRGLTPDHGEVLVTGAAGGVGSVAVALLTARGYRVVASTGREAAHPYLRDLGATEIVSREALSEPVKRPLESERWAACIDSVGGTTLGRVLGQLQYGTSVAAVGLAGGSRLDTTVVPFLLRGVNLLGIDSVMCPMERRRQAWQRLATELAPSVLARMVVNAGLADVIGLAPEILAGRVRGRVVIDVRR